MRPLRRRRCAPGEHVKLNNGPVLLYLYRGGEHDEHTPWQDERCGTYAGWNAHTYLREKPCPPCKRAHREYMQQWRLRTGRTKTIRTRPAAGLLALLEGQR